MHARSDEFLGDGERRLNLGAGGLALALELLGHGCFVCAQLGQNLLLYINSEQHQSSTVSCMLCCGSLYCTRLVPYRLCRRLVARAHARQQTLTEFNVYHPIHSKPGVLGNWPEATRQPQQATQLRTVHLANITKDGSLLTVPGRHDISHQHCQEVERTWQTATASAMRTVMYSSPMISGMWAFSSSRMIWREGLLITGWMPARL